MIQGILKLFFSSIVLVGLYFRLRRRHLQSLFLDVIVSPLSVSTFGMSTLFFADLHARYVVHFSELRKEIRVILSCLFDLLSLMHILICLLTPSIFSSSLVLLLLCHLLSFPA